MAEWWMFGVTLASVTVAIVAVAFGRADAKRRKQEVREANDLARAGNATAARGHAAASTASRAAERSADAAREANVVSRQANTISAEANRTTVEANKVTAAALAATEERQRRIDDRETEYHRVEWVLGWAMPYPARDEEVIDHSLHIGNRDIDDALDVRVTLKTGSSFTKVVGLGKIDGYSGHIFKPLASSTDATPHPDHHGWLLFNASLFLNRPCDVLIEWRTAAGARRSQRQEMPSLLDYPAAVERMRLENEE